MSINYGTDYVYAREKLPGSYVTMGDSIIMVEGIDDGGLVEGFDLKTEKHIVTDMNSISTLPPRLGYVNQDRYARYVARTPARHYRQGFRPQTLRSVSAVGSVPRLRFNKDFVLSINSLYPDVETAVERVINDEDRSCAFSRRFGVFKKKTNLYLEYKGYEVGSVNMNNAELQLAPKFIFLEEVLENDAQ